MPVFPKHLDYFDISPVISEKIAVFPGDVPFLREVGFECQKGDHLTLSAMYTTLHVGAHTDAPNHYHRDGEGIGARDLSFYMGPCQVISLDLPRSKRIEPRHLKDIKITSPRVLFKTNSFPDPNHWNGDFNSLSPQIIDDMASHDICLVGIDTPSIDPAEDKELPAHQAVFKNKMAILEGVVLNEVPDGEYFLIALPLRIENGDASPVRAILLKQI